MTKSYQPKHDTDPAAARAYLAEWTKAELIAWIDELRVTLTPVPVFNGAHLMTKTQLVDAAQHLAVLLIAVAKEAKADADAARQRILTDEAADGLKARMLAAAAEGVAKLADNAKAAYEKEAAAIATDPIHRLTWDAGSMFKKHALHQELAPIAAFFAKPEQTDKTLAELDEILEGWAESKIDAVTRPHLMGSTNPWSNAAEVAMHAGKCTAARMARRLLELWKDRRADAARYDYLGW